MARRRAAGARGTRRPRKASARAAGGDHDGDAADCVRRPPKEHGAGAGGGFFCCYLLRSLCPRSKGRTYIGFTVNPRRRIRQHNGEIVSGAWQTRRGRPWEMVLCIYGFPSNVAALQFEWAWQNPAVSLAVRKAAAEFKALTGIANKIKLAYAMLNLPSWENLNLTVNFFSSKNINYTAGCPALPSQMKTVICPMEDLQCHAEGPSSGEDDINEDSQGDQEQPDSDSPLDSEHSDQALEQLSSQLQQPTGEQTRIPRFDAEEGEDSIDDSRPMEWGGILDAIEEPNGPRTSPRCSLSPFGDDGRIVMDGDPGLLSPGLMVGDGSDDSSRDEQQGHLFHEKGVVDLVTPTPIGRTRRRDCVASSCPRIIDLTTSPVVIQL